MQGVCILKVLGVLAIWGPFPAFSAADPTPDTFDAQDTPILLQTGDRAMFDGLLVPLSMAASLTAKVEGCEERIKLLRQENAELVRLEVGLCENLRENDRKSHAWRVRLLEQAAPAWWEHPAVWFAVGLASAIVVVAGSVSILDATRPLSANLRIESP